MKGVTWEFVQNSDKMILFWVPEMESYYSGITRELSRLELGLIMVIFDAFECVWDYIHSVISVYQIIMSKRRLLKDSRQKRLI